MGSVLAGKSEVIPIVTVLVTQKNNKECLFSAPVVGSSSFILLAFFVNRGTAGKSSACSKATLYLTGLGVEWSSFFSASANRCSLPYSPSQPFTSGAICSAGFGPRGNEIALILWLPGSSYCLAQI